MAKKQMKTSSGGNSNIVAALAYLLGFISGIIVYLLKKDDSFARFHAVQSIIWFILIWAVNFILGVTVIGIILIPLVGLIALVSWLVLMYKALKGDRYKLPYVGNWAEQYA